MKQKSFVYTGCENLEVMKGAYNYNNFLISVVKSAYARIDKKVPKVLDFGAGTGTYTDMLAAEGIKADCLEPDKDLQKLLKSNGFDVHQNIKSLGKTKYDLIYSLNVLEHIEEDAEVLKDLYNVVAPQGLIMIYVPAFQVLYSSMDRKVEHFRRYRKKDLENKVKQAGFEVVESRYCDPIGFAAAMAYKLFGNRQGDINVNAIKFYDRLLFPISSGLEGITRSAFGKNVLLVAKKKK